MPEGQALLMLLSGVACWRLGGMGAPPFRRWWRRAVWPLVAGGLLLWANVPVGTAVLCAVSLSATTLLGYGETVPWWRKTLVFASYALPSCWLSFHLLGLRVMLVSLLIAGAFLLSHWDNRFSHGLVEMACGFLQGMTLVWAV